MILIIILSIIKQVEDSLVYVSIADNILQNLTTSNINLIEFNDVSIAIASAITSYARINISKIKFKI